MLQCLEHFLPSIFTDHGVRGALSLTLPHSSLSDAVAQRFSAFLKYVIIEVPAVYTEVPALASGGGQVSFGAIWNWLFSDIGQLLVSS